MTKNQYLEKIALFLIVAGAISLIAILAMTFLVLKNPSEFEISHMILSALEISEPVLSGKLGEQTFELNASEPMRYVFFGFVGLFLLSMTLGITKAMLLSGIALAKYVDGSKVDGDEQNQYK